MAVHVLVAVTTHNNIISTNLVWGLYNAHSPHVTPDDSQVKHFPRFFLLSQKNKLYRDSFISPYGPTHFNPPPEGFLRPCVATHFSGWDCVGCVRSTGLQQEASYALINHGRLHRNSIPSSALKRMCVCMRVYNSGGVLHMRPSMRHSD